MAEMISLEIPDPFMDFVKQRDRNRSSLCYDYFAREWSARCGCCKEELFAPTKKIMTKIRLYHTRNECTGGW